MELNLINGYLNAYKIACENFKNRDTEEISLNSNAAYDKLHKKLCLKYLNKDYLIDCFSGEIMQKDSEEQVTSTIKVLIMHYLLNAKAKPLSGNLVSFKDLRGGAAIYYDTFRKRAILPLIKTFGNNPQLLYKAAELLNGTKERFGNASVTINVLPLVPVTYVIWQGDEEVPASGTVLLDESIESYLPDEDIVCAASFGVYALIAQAWGNG